MRSGEKATALRVLDYWRRIELLSPPILPYLRGRTSVAAEPELDLPEAVETRPDSRIDVVLDVEADGDLPWLDGRTGRTRQGREWTFRHTVYLGLHPVAPLVSELCRHFGTSDDPEPPARPRYSCLAAFSVDGDGVPVPGSFTLCSLAWAIGRLRSGESLHGFDAAAADLATAWNRRAEQAGTLSVEALWAETATLCDALGWSTEEVDVVARVRRREVPVGSEDDDTPILSSFYFEDLGTVLRAVEHDDAGVALSRYLGADRPQEHVDIRSPLRRDALMALLAPQATPPGRWPAPGGARLALMQQAAVNRIGEVLAAGSGMVSVNGPPGTGKTTLLRDVIAAVLVQRARVLCGFEHPLDAFSRSGDAVERTDRVVHAWKLAPSLHGFEMVVASSNNGAVENVTNEIPAQTAVSGEFAAAVDYFSSTATAVLSCNTDTPVPAWGLMAAVLGRMSRRRSFAEAFWFDRDAGFFRVLTPPPPGNWQRARAALQEALQREQRLRDRAAEWAAALAESAESGTPQQRLAEVNAYRTTITALRHRRAAAERTLAGAEESARHAYEQLRAVQALRPSRLQRWRGADTRVADDELRAAQVAHRQRMAAVDSLRAELRQLVDEEDALAADLAAAEEDVESARRRAAVLDAALAEARDSGAAIPDERFWSASDDERETLLPWLTAEHQRARQEVFAQAVLLHRAFAMEARAPVLDNLGIMVELLKGRVQPERLPNTLSDVWATLFLVVPVVSTTFASLPRLFRGMGRESIGWLLLDEAGQAAPQLAAGALWRARRAVVIGDPLQVEPVVTLPEGVTAALRGRLGVDVEWDPRAASAQTLADAANPVGTTVSGKWVGCPLRVHRRCVEPMFSLANDIAYDGTMVYATRPSPSPIGELLGDSAWFDVTGDAVAGGHWIPEQGLALLTMLARTLELRRLPDAFVLSPFRSVAEAAQDLVRDRLSAGFITRADLREWVRTRVGTVHTFQGKEAEAVVLLLGGDTRKMRALHWAGERPNLLNVAATRARRRLYVVGDRRVWARVPLFGEMVERLPQGDVRALMSGETLL